METKGDFSGLISKVVEIKKMGEEIVKGEILGVVFCEGDKIGKQILKLLIAKVDGPNRGETILEKIEFNEIGFSVLLEIKP